MRHNRRLLDNDIDEVLMALVYLDNLKDMTAFIDDLLTPNELEVIAQRWRAVRMLKAGITYNKISKATGISSATIARLSKLLSRRSGGFAQMLKNME